MEQRIPGSLEKREELSYRSQRAAAGLKYGSEFAIEKKPVQAQTPLVSRVIAGGRSTQPHHADLIQPGQAVSTAHLKERNQYGSGHAT